MTNSPSPEALRAVLKPFAEAAQCSPTKGVFYIPDEHPMIISFRNNKNVPITVTMGDLRRAAEAYAALSAQSAIAEPNSAEHVEEAAKLLCSWIGYAWEGCGDMDISDEYPDWAYNGIGTKDMQGGKPALRKIARAMLAAAPAIQVKP